MKQKYNSFSEMVKNQIALADFKEALNKFKFLIKSNKQEALNLIEDLYNTDLNSAIILETLFLVNTNDDSRLEYLVKKIVESELHSLKFIQDFLDDAVCNFLNKESFNYRRAERIDTFFEKFKIKLSYKNLYNRLSIRSMIYNDSSLYKNIKEYTGDKQINIETKRKSYYNFGLLEFQQKNFKEGSLRTASHKKIKSNFHNSDITINHMVWDGVQKQNPVLVQSFYGIGDFFVYSRFFKKLQKMGIEFYVVYFAQDISLETTKNIKSAQDVFSRQNINFISDKQQYIELICSRSCDFYRCELSDLPVLFDLDWGDLWESPYIHAEKKYIEKWKPIIKKSKKIKVGLRWQGNPLFPSDSLRSLNLEEIYNIIDNYDVEIYSLQKNLNESKYDISDYKNIVPLDSELETWNDTIAAIHLMDIIITSCTSIAHVASAMGKRTIVITPPLAYHIWENGLKENPEESAWYSNKTTVLRQKELGDFSHPYKRLIEIFDEEICNN
jgi:hypothetical protein